MDENRRCGSIPLCRDAQVPRRPGTTYRDVLVSREGRMPVATGRERPPASTKKLNGVHRKVYPVFHSPSQAIHLAPGRTSLVQARFSFSIARSMISL